MYNTGIVPNVTNPFTERGNTLEVLKGIALSAYPHLTGAP
ncbi:hypothetical protein ANABIO32_43030 [Rossellomorea marisflavi]|nr:hypothetical protein ANABIO32_43030 [Rossellomorea marisflavi]